MGSKWKHHPTDSNLKVKGYSTSFAENLGKHCCDNVFKSSYFYINPFRLFCDFLVLFCTEDKALWIHLKCKFRKPILSIYKLLQNIQNLVTLPVKRHHSIWPLSNLNIKMWKFFKLFSFSKKLQIFCLGFKILFHVSVGRWYFSATSILFFFREQSFVSLRMKLLFFFFLVFCSWKNNVYYIWWEKYSEVSLIYW